MSSLAGLKVVTAREMARVEKLAYDAGASEEAFMEKAGLGIADRVEEFVLDEGLDKTVYLLVGKGNNGGDAYVAGYYLLKRGFQVVAYHFYPSEECSPLSIKQKKRYSDQGGEDALLRLEEEILFSDSGLILDGLFGTGFSGSIDGILKGCINRANQSGLPILSIDIPSGVNGSTGVVETVAIQATQTIFLGLPKLGFFREDGWNYIGDLTGVDFGIDPLFLEQAKAEAKLLNEEALPSVLPTISRTQHKYEAGYVLGVGASPSMPGAAQLTCLAALRSGAGIVRLFYPEGMEEELSASSLEIIKEAWDLKEPKRIREEAERARAFFIGPGMGRSKEAKRAFLHLIEKITIPTVIDADGLYFLSEESSWEPPAKCILTPHRQEMRRLLPQGSTDLYLAAQKMADQKNVTIVLKGGPTTVFHPFTLPLIIPHGDPGMATAGTGDVLTGVIAALLAQQVSPYEAAVLGVFLHAIAGEEAAFEKGSHSMIASDVINALPEAFAFLEGNS